MKQLVKIIGWGLLLALAIYSLPLVGVILNGGSASDYLGFPPQTERVEQAPFSIAAFVAMAIMIMAVILPFIARVLTSRLQPGAPRRSRRFPWWGWLGLLLAIAGTVLAWTRFSWAAPFQRFTFTPHWLGYIVVVNALTFRRTGRCMLKDRPRYLLSLFVASGIFWWFFEYLNRFIMNWHYVDIGDMTVVEYFVYASLPFSTVLPAVMGTYELIDSIPRVAAGTDAFVPVRVRHPRTLGGAGLAASCLSLALIGLWPDYLFPLVWVSPLFIIVSVQALRGRPTILDPLGQGNWRRVYLLALSALVCGFFWEAWNQWSLARWEYQVPLVHALQVFKMPVLGYAGYLPFGLECAVVADMVGSLFDRKEREER